MTKYPTKPEACKQCPAYTWGLGFVPHTGSLDSPIALVGQGPGEQEAAASRPFYPNAPSGSMLDRWLNKAGKSRTQTIVCNIVQCWLPKSKSKSGQPSGNRMPTQDEVAYCWNAHVGPTLHASKAKFIVPIGAPSTKWFLGLPDKGVEKYTGTFTKLDLPEITNERTRTSRNENNARSSNRNPRTTHEEHGRAVQHHSENSKVDTRRTSIHHSGLGETRESNHSFDAGLLPVELSELQETADSLSEREVVSLLQRSLKAGNPRWVMPLTHPAAIVRGRWELGPVQEVFIKRVLDHAFNNTEPELQNPTLPPPNTKLYPTLKDIEEFIVEVKTLGAYTLDIEEAGEHIICVGMTAIELTNNIIGTTVCLRFRHQGGGLYWEKWEDHLAAVKHLQTLLLLPVTKIFQNGITFDVPELQALGFEISGPFIDTMHLAHTAYCELPKSLQFLATLYLGAPVWKTLVDNEELEGKG